jgi:hypothetical protein
MACGMGIGLATAGLGLVGGLLGGGGPRQPRMNGAQRELLKSQADKNRAMTQLMRSMTQMMGRMMHQSMGGHAGNPNGHCCKRGMNGVGCGGVLGGSCGLSANSLGGMMNLNIGNLPPGTQVNINLPQMPFAETSRFGQMPFSGNGFRLAGIPQLGAEYAVGVLGQFGW